MKALHNIEKSGFRRGEYIGYAAGKVWRIVKSKGAYGNWLAYDMHNPKGNDTLYAWTLASLSLLLKMKGGEV